MKLSAESLPYHELVGLRVRVFESSDRSLSGLEGLVMDETRNMLLIDSNGVLRRVAKAVCRFEFELPRGQRVAVMGSLLVGRPEERVGRLKR